MKRLVLILILFAFQNYLYAQEVNSGSTDKVAAPLTLDSEIPTDYLILEKGSPLIQPANKTGVHILAVPANDDCSNATLLTVDAACVTGTTKEGTTQSGENFSCQGSPTASVWYKFVANSTDMFVEVRMTASSGCYLSSAVWSGSCLPSSNLDCEDAAGGPTLNIHNLTGLTVGATYYIQVSYAGGGPCGPTSGGSASNTGADFCINVGKTVSCATCNNTCGPLCVFASQPTVAQVTSLCTKYDLKPKLNSGESKTGCYTFTANSTTFNLQMIVNSVGCSGGNVTSFTWTLQSSSCGSTLQSGSLSNLNATGLTIGQSYVLCYTWTAACEHDAVWPYIVSNTPLPVELIDFHGEMEINRVELEWTTATEINNNYFTIERASIKDGKQVWSPIGRVEGAGNSTSAVRYHFIDASPFASERNLNSSVFYRLKQTDFDGKYSYSPIITLSGSGKNLIQVLPNPVNDLLFINVNASENDAFTFSVLNAFGQSVYSRINPVSSGFNQFNVDVSNFSKGAYFVKIEYKDKIISCLVIKE